MSFENQELDQDKETENRLERYKELTRQASNLRSQAVSLRSNFDALQLMVSNQTKAELDAKFQAFVLQLRNDLGL